jgi:hypothetical protein
VNITHASGYNLTAKGGTGTNTLNLDEVLGDRGGPFNPNPVPQGAGSNVLAKYSLPGLVSTFNYSNMPLVTQLPNPDKSFVQALFHDVYGRSGSQDELNYWAAQLPLLGQGGVVSAINHTQEAYTKVVDDWFQQYLKEAPAASELTHYTGELSDGQTQEQVLSQILGTPEFLKLVHQNSQESENEAYVEALYSYLLNIPEKQIAPSDLRRALDELHRIGREGLAKEFLTGSAFRTIQVTADYGRLLHRPPTLQEMSVWVNSGLDLLTIQIGIESLPEFYTFGG